MWHTGSLYASGDDGLVSGRNGWCKGEDGLGSGGLEWMRGWHGTERQSGCIWMNVGRQGW